MEAGISLKKYNTFGLEAFAKKLVHITSEEKMFCLLEAYGLPDLILGGGSNILFSGQAIGLAVLNRIEGKSILEENEEKTLVQVGGGENWHEVVQWAIEWGLGGIENLSLIPGTAGAAPIQNIGAYGVELKDVFHSLDAIDLESRKQRVFSKKECDFSYRNSFFKQHKGRFFITNIRLELSKKAVVNTSYGAIREVLDQKGIGSPTIKEVSDAVIAIRSSKLPDPQQLGNAGSFFKNPLIPYTQFEGLKKRFPNIVYYPVGGHDYKIPAGWLIEQCGFKGKREGAVGCYEKQALVVVNYGGAGPREVLAWVEKIEAAVRQKFGIQLDREVNVV